MLEAVWRLAQPKNHPVNFGRGDGGSAKTDIGEIVGLDDVVLCNIGIPLHFSGFVFHVFAHAADLIVVGKLRDGPTFDYIPRLLIRFYALLEILYAHDQ